MGVVLITGSSGLVGSECCRHFAALGYTVHGIDGNQRRDYFGPDGDTRPNLERLKRDLGATFIHHDIDVRDLIKGWVRHLRPTLVLHCAAQPSHDLASRRPVEDFRVNALGTLNMLEATRQHAPDAVFCFASTNKVYGDFPNRLALVERKTRWDFAYPHRQEGINENCPIDQSRHSIFGASKAAADLMVQEYGRTFNLRTGCFRFGCLTGAAHAGVELHGFLSYLARCCAEGRRYRVYGHKGKQVRDQLHAADVARAFELFAAAPRQGEVYNLGGGRVNSVSVLEAIEAVESASGKRLDWQYVEEARGGDHVCYYSDNSKFQAHYPEWTISRPLESIIEELCQTPCEVA